MERKITVTLSDEAHEYFCDVAYSLDNGDGKPVTQSEIINHCLLELAVFEELSGQSVTGYLSECYPEAYKDLISKFNLVKKTS